MGEREQVVRWRDPGEALAVLPRMSGLDYLRAMRDGELPGPPIASHIPMMPTEVEEGSVTFECVPDESHYNPIGAVHGGLVCTLLDSVLGCATHTTLPVGVGYTSIEIKVNYLRPIMGDTGTLTAVGRVTKPGRRVAFAEGEVRDSASRLVATASSSLLIFPMGQ